MTWGSMHVCILPAEHVPKGLKWPLQTLSGLLADITRFLFAFDKIMFCCCTVGRLDPRQQRYASARYKLGLPWRDGT